MLNSWLHVLSLTVYLGALFGLWFVLMPSVAMLDDLGEKTKLLARGLRLYNPLQVGALGIVLFSGAFRLTDLKAAYRETFIQEFGVALAIKLSLAFLVVLLSVYQSMGIGHRFVKRYDSGDGVTAQDLELVVKRLMRANWLIVPVVILTVWYGLRLAH
jgi:uncharacterized membrane protein